MKKQTMKLCYLLCFNVQLDFVIRDDKKRVLWISVGCMFKTELFSEVTDISPETHRKLT